jgi:hypothetical protein
VGVAIFFLLLLAGIAPLDVGPCCLPLPFFMRPPQQTNSTKKDIEISFFPITPVAGQHYLARGTSIKAGRKGAPTIHRRPTCGSNTYLCLGRQQQRRQQDKAFLNAKKKEETMAIGLEGAARICPFKKERRGASHRRIKK